MKPVGFETDSFDFGMNLLGFEMDPVDFGMDPEGFAVLF